MTITFPRETCAFTCTWKFIYGWSDNSKTTRE